MKSDWPRFELPPLTKMSAGTIGAIITASLYSVWMLWFAYVYFYEEDEGGPMFVAGITAYPLSILASLLVASFAEHLKWVARHRLLLEFISIYFAGLLQYLALGYASGKVVSRLRRRLLKEAARK